MKNRLAISVFWALTGTTVLTATAFAHDMGSHGHGTSDAQMKKLHAMMPMFAVAVAGMDEALAKEDTATVKKEAHRILHEIPELKRSKPHKHAEQRKRFAEHADLLKAAVTTTMDLAGKGDLAAARHAFSKIGEACTACHAVFRD